MSLPSQFCHCSLSSVIAVLILSLLSQYTQCFQRSVIALSVHSLLLQFCHCSLSTVVALLVLSLLFFLLSLLSQFSHWYPWFLSQFWHCSPITVIALIVLALLSQYCHYLICSVLLLQFCQSFLGCVILLTIFCMLSLYVYYFSRSTVITLSIFSLFSWLYNCFLISDINIIIHVIFNFSCFRTNPTSGKPSAIAIKITALFRMISKIMVLALLVNLFC